MSKCSTCDSTCECIEILSITAAQSQITGQATPVRSVFGLGSDNQVYGWDWDQGEWELWKV